MQQRHIGGLDLVRFWAALSVCVFHLGYWCWAFPAGLAGTAAVSLPFRPDLQWVGSFGWAGVEVFFVISGFVITYSAERATAGSFVRSRILRLVPAVWICAPISAAAVLVFTSAALSDVGKRVIRSVIFLPFGPWIDSVYWTLGIEIAFYSGVWALLCFGRFRWLERAIVTLGLLSTAFWLLMLIRYNEASYASRLLDLALIHHGQLFAIGVLLSKCASQNISLRRTILIVIFAAGSCLQLYIRAGVEAAKTGFDLPAWPAMLMWLLSMAAMIAALRWPLRWTWLRAVGLMTYPLYLIHNVAGAAILGGLYRAGLSLLAAMAVSLVLAISTSWLIATIIEPRVTAVLRPRLGWMMREPKF